MLDNFYGSWESCARRLALKLDAKHRKIFYLETGLAEVHILQAQRNARNFDAAEQYVLSYLAIHCGLTVHRANPGTPTKDLIAFKDGVDKACTVQVKWRKDDRSPVSLTSTENLDFVVVVVPEYQYQFANGHSARRHLDCYIVPASHVRPNKNVGYRYSNYQENWDLILGHFEEKMAA